MKDIKLTQYSHGAGCGCKISPKVLSKIINKDQISHINNRLLVGNDNSDDAAVYDMGDGTAIISTTDFFMPIVDDPFIFGKIAATNAISDVYAMGGNPIMAIAILGWPINNIKPEIANIVLEGGRCVCSEASIPLAGGHSIDSPEPIFGLAVTGQLEIKNMKRNDTATEGCHLFLTKPLGIGVLSTAQKKGKLLKEHEGIAVSTMLTLNKIGQDLAQIKGVTAMTDVTGFGLLGHLAEMCEGSNVSAEIELEKIPIFKGVSSYISQRCVPGGTSRNWNSYGHKVVLKHNDCKDILCDPQTSGGLLIAVSQDSISEVKMLLSDNDIKNDSFGKLIAKKDRLIYVE